MFAKIAEAIELAKNQGIHMDPIDTDIVLKAGILSNNTGLGVDLWEPILVQAVLREAAQALADLLNEKL